MGFNKKIGMFIIGILVLCLTIGLATAADFKVIDEGPVAIANKTIEPVVIKPVIVEPDPFYLSAVSSKAVLKHNDKQVSFEISDGSNKNIIGASLKFFNKSSISATVDSLGKTVVNPIVTETATLNYKELRRGEKIKYAFDFSSEQDHIKVRIVSDQNFSRDGYVLKYLEGINEFTFNKKVYTEYKWRVYDFNDLVDNNPNASITLTRVTDKEYVLEMINVTDYDPEIRDDYTSDPGGVHYNTTWDATNQQLRSANDALYCGKYDLNYSGNTDFDDCASGNDATLDTYTTSGACDDGNCAWATGQNGNALQFDGVGDYVTISNNPELNFTGAHTMVFLVNPGIVSGNRPLLFKSTTSYYVWLTTAGVIEYVTKGLSDTSLSAASTNLTVDVWNHLVFTYNTTHKFIYFNGEELVSEATTGTMDTNDEDVDIGIFSGNEYFGLIDEVQFYNCSLNATTISEINTTVGITGLCDNGSDGLVGHYALNETSGNIAVDSTGNNNVTLNGYSRPYFNSTGGKYLGAYEFDGVNNDVTISGGIDTGTEMTEITLSSWIYLKSQRNVEGFVSAGASGENDGLYIRTRSTDRPLFVVSNGTTRGLFTFLTGDEIPVNTWTHLVFTANQTHKSYYINGTLQSTRGLNILDPVYNSSNDFEIGCGYDCNNEGFNGTMDDFMVWDRELFAAEILTLYNGTNARHNFNPSYFERPYWESDIIDFNETTQLQSITFSGSFDNNTKADRDISNTNLVSWWTLDNITTDLTGNADGTENDIQLTSQGINGSYYFDGAGDYISVASNSDFDLTEDKNLTINAWIKPTTGTEANYNTIFSDCDGSLTGDTGYYIYVRSSNLYLSYNNGTGGGAVIVTTTTPITYGEWNFVSVVIDRPNNNVSMYVNCNLELTQAPAKSGTWAKDTTNYLGTVNPSVFNLDGMLDEVKIYDKILNSSEMLENYRREKGNKLEVETRSSNVDQEVLNDNTGLVGFWDLNDGTGATTFEDRSGYGNNGICTSCPTSVSSEVMGTAFDFNGNGIPSGIADYIQVADKPELEMVTNDMTISAWVKLTESQTLGAVAHKYSVYPLYFFGVSGGQIYSRIGYNSSLNYIISDGTIINDGEWHHIVVVYDRDGYMSRYLDGDNVGTNVDISAIDGLDLSSTNSFMIGGVISTYGFNGSIDHVMVYNRTLSESEIEELYYHANFSGQDWYTNDPVNLQTGVSTVNTNIPPGRYFQYRTTGANIDNDLLIDGDFEATGTGNYTTAFDAVLSKQSTNPYQGSQVLRVEWNGSNYPAAKQSIMTPGIKYHVTGWARGDGTALPRIYAGSGIYPFIGTTSTDWQRIDVVYIPTLLHIQLTAWTTVAGYVEFDDLKVDQVPYGDTEFTFELTNISFTGNQSPVTTIIDMDDDVIVTNSTPYFQFNVTDLEGNGIDVELYINGTKSGILTGLSSGDEVNLTSNATLTANTYYEWYLNATDGIGWSTTTARDFYYATDLQLDEVIFGTPAITEINYTHTLTYIPDHKRYIYLSYVNASNVSNILKYATTPFTFHYNFSTTRLSSWSNRDATRDLSNINGTIGGITTNAVTTFVNATVSNAGGYFLVNFSYDVSAQGDANPAGGSSSGGSVITHTPIGKNLTTPVPETLVISELKNYYYRGEPLLFIVTAPEGTSTVKAHIKTDAEDEGLSEMNFDLIKINSTHYVSKFTKTAELNFGLYELTVTSDKGVTGSDSFELNDDRLLNTFKNIELDKLTTKQIILLVVVSLLAILLGVSLYLIITGGDDEKK